MAKKVFVSGCFDMLHSGHVAFFEEAATYGDVYVGLGSDRTIFDLKGRSTVNPENERLYMVRSLKWVTDVWINSGCGLLDFHDDFLRIGPDILFVNEDGHTPEKEALCKHQGVEYIISKRLPRLDMAARSTTLLRKVNTIPYRIDLAGGWLDQPYVSKYCPGPVITISIEPDYEFNDRSGMATSTRRKAIELWQNRIPPGDSEKLAYTLFCLENPPGTTYVSGSQDPLGIVLPGLNRLHYKQGEYWPAMIAKNLDDQVLTWIEQHLCLIPLEPRQTGFNVLDDMQITPEMATELSDAAENLWEAALKMDSIAFGKAMIRSFNAQVSMFPLMKNETVDEAIGQIKERCCGYKLSGAGGGGYLVLFTEEELNFGLKIRIRRTL
jgi:cytidyltransferase-like protein